MSSGRAEHEIEHGKLLAASNAEATWGWGTRAGRLRAERRAELIANGARLNAHMQVLEIGCGTGMFTEMFARSGARIIAVDISAELLAKAEARNLPTSQVRFLAKRFEECDVDGPFDAVIGSSVLHHLDLQKSLSKIYELLKPGGCLSFAEPNMLNPQVFLERKLSFIRPVFWYVSPDETAFVRWSLAKILSRIGFVSAKIIPFDWLHPAIPPRAITAVRWVGQWLENVPGLKEFSGSLMISAWKSDL
jgi:2-polyprenyl-3-methyl-5-hydroxy-6-metoxy-1,4-benzoquinol methylase